ncbi:MAG: bis(5'-nucleosyl)-tetraphosphatase (symmetrical) YqeK [Oscillospiraceae bacterium]|nr:bis(5'-nucleosyl)-tetraphosphatase (symmetrical) YqeK [Oscillospiraceae bacterium]
MNIFDLPYIKQINMTGNTEKDAIGLLMANNCSKIAGHSLDVAKTGAKLARRFGLDEKTAYDTGILHDISGVMKPADMMAYACNSGWYMDESEKKHPFILHQRISAVIAEKVFDVKNKIILSAVSCHSTLKSNPSEQDMLLFLADKIAWDREETPPFLDVVYESLHISLARASLTYIQYALENGLIISPHTWLIQAKEWLEKSLKIAF